MSSQDYLYRAPRKPRSTKGVGSSPAFLFGLSRGFYLPPRESFHRAGYFNQLSKKSSPKVDSPQSAKRFAGLGLALARLLGRQSGGV